MDTKGKIELKKAFNIPKNQNNDQSILIIFDSFNFGSLSSSSQASRKFREKKEISTSWSIDQSLLGMGAEIYRNSTKIETNGGALSFGTPCKLWVLKKNFRRFVEWHYRVFKVKDRPWIFFFSNQ